MLSGRNNRLLRTRNRNELDEPGSSRLQIQLGRQFDMDGVEYFPNP